MKHNPPPWYGLPIPLEDAMELKAEVFDIKVAYQEGRQCGKTRLQKKIRDSYIFNSSYMFVGSKTYEALRQFFARDGLPVPSFYQRADPAPYESEYDLHFLREGKKAPSQTAHLMKHYLDMHLDKK